MDESKEQSNVLLLKNFRADEGDIHSYQPVRFYEMHEDASFDNGTTLEEMLRVSIERLTSLNAKFPCRENALAITKMEEALHWLNARTADRVKRGVEGTHQA